MTELSDSLPFQCGGFSPVPEALQRQNVFLNIFGHNAHMLASKSDPNTIVWKYVVSTLFFALIYHCS